jgi:hypothetical protein
MFRRDLRHNRDMRSPSGGFVALLCLVLSTAMLAGCGSHARRTPTTAGAAHPHQPAGALPFTEVQTLAASSAQLETPAEVRFAARLRRACRRAGGAPRETLASIAAAPSLSREAQRLRALARALGRLHPPAPLGVPLRRYMSLLGSEAQVDEQIAADPPAGSEQLLAGQQRNFNAARRKKLAQQIEDITGVHCLTPVGG